MVGAFLMPIFKGTQWFFSLNFMCQKLPKIKKAGDFVL